MAKEISNDELAEIINDSLQRLKSGVNKQFKTLKDGQEDVKIKLDNV